VITFQSQYDSNQDNIYHSKTVILWNIIAI